MAKNKSVFVCQQCGQQFPRWSGQCASCNAWNSLVEETTAPLESTRHSSLEKKIDVSKYAVSFPEVALQMGQNRRISTGIGELDRVLGGASEDGEGGMVPGGVTLIGGEPGIGKSTLLTQLVIKQLVRLQKSPAKNKSVLYVCGEENPTQVAGRVERLAVEQQLTKEVTEALILCASTQVEVIEAIITKTKPVLVIIDSIQTTVVEDLSGGAGSVGQIRESALRLTEVAKAYSIPLFLVGHVTKDGELAGPKVLEHMVDAVLELSGDRTGDLRLLRSVKNRFGATDEVGVFRLDESGLLEVSNPSELLVEHDESPMAGSAVAMVMEGTRPIGVEVQALVVHSPLAMPRRVGQGIETSRLQIITAILQKYSRVALDSQDIFVSLLGGYKTKDPGLDLAIAMAIASSAAGVALPKRSVFFGEVGLLGEVRRASFASRREKEAKRLGYEHIYSAHNVKTITKCMQQFDLIKKSSGSK